MNIASFSQLHGLNSKQRKDCMLINEVKRYTFLYDRNEMNHKRSRYRKAAWDEIGKKLGMDGIDCLNRWKMLRERYRREKKMKNRGPMSVRGKRWLYYDLCRFLDPYLDDVKPFLQELDEVMNEESQSGEDSQDYSHSENKSDEKDSSLEESSTSFNVSSLNMSPPIQSSASFSVAPLNDSNTSSSSVMPPSTYIRIIMPPTDQPQPSTTTTVTPKPKSRAKKSTIKPSPRKYVKILPKTEMPTQKSSWNGVEETSNDSIDLSMYKDPDKMDNVDHLMAFMGNTIKQLSLKKQTKICQELTSAFFNIISNEEEDCD